MSTRALPIPTIPPPNMMAAVLPPQVHTLPHRLAANEGHVPESQLGWLRPTTMDTPLSVMRHRLQTDKYLFLKGVIPREDVLAMRAHYFSQYNTTDLLDPSQPASLGIFNPSASPSSHAGIGSGSNPAADAELQILINAHTTPQYRDGPQSRVLGLGRDMLRHNVPGGKSTGVHYDKLFLRGGDAFFLTAWVPIGDIAYNGGGLIYLEDSAELGEAIEEDFTRRAEAGQFSEEEKISAFNKNMSATGILSDNPTVFHAKHKEIAERIRRERKGYKWLTADYEAGDVVFHYPGTIHASGRNEDPKGRIRLSTDLRFYSKEDYERGATDERWGKFWVADDGL
ncbi:uncharacterized protein AB675_2571 [Cyphellophora attinorum]|uniref:Phytanoyl-CoA dioxygenase domain-containing protein 1 n=1 Tax=Cyphellophora attinorum TaxID=1664694 RepID=A0A0N1HH94_9EURO|nr:uncharacterized protein AB675_2571 [Phialophora attinorum]KPI45275.1 hypothetical protein AB675_2571 [Phialophora attinorum]